MKRILPAYPLFVKDPNFSFWAQSETLYGKDVIFWTGQEKKLNGFLKVNGELYCFMGKWEGEYVKQESLSVTAYTTDYEFTVKNIRLKVSFVSPLPLDDLETLSMPVCYMKYEVTGGDVEVIVAVERSVCSNSGDLPVRGGSIPLDGFRAAFFGLKRQTPFSDDSDRRHAECGYWYLTGEEAYFSERSNCLISRSKKNRGIVMLGYDDTVSINYFGEHLKGYYLDRHTIFEALTETYRSHENIEKSLVKSDKDLAERCKQFGNAYHDILIASLRQSIAAHKLVSDRDGNLLFLSKECYSNGCIATVDVSYPSVPLYLLYNPELVRGMLRPIFKFAKMPVWKYGFAPHDVGTYPNCCGQVYGLKEEDEQLSSMLGGGEEQTRFPVWQLPKNADVYKYESQMPVEESANMLIMLYAACVADGKTEMLEEEFPLLRQWAEYLTENGLKPENQLCTDDFSGHLKNNLNLAIKAAVGIACFAEICKLTGKEGYEKFRKISEEFAKEITSFGKKFSHLPLTWDSGEETYSLKYNLAFDKLLGLKLFSDEMMENEVSYYLTKSNDYGIPLDNRADFTKSDWLVWTAYLNDSLEKQKSILNGINRYLKESEDKLPFGDWYDTKTGRLIGFRNRTVQGGCFMLLLTNLLSINI